MGINEGDLRFIEDQLSAFGDFYTKRMFGGVGFFREGLMFAMMSSTGEFRLKVDDSNRADYETAGMEPLYHKKDRTKRPMDYWQVPVHVLENKELLANWANAAYAIAVRKKK
jgi:DNA transformation protein